MAGAARRASLRALRACFARLRTLRSTGCVFSEAHVPGKNKFPRLRLAAQILRSRGEREQPSEKTDGCLVILPAEGIFSVGAGQGFAELEVVPPEALALVEAVGVRAQRVAGELELDAALREGRGLRRAQ